MTLYSLKLCASILIIVTGDKEGSLRFIYVLSNFPIIGMLLIMQLKFWDFNSVDQAVDLLPLLI
jgi:hypothetical protein